MYEFQRIWLVIMKNFKDDNEKAQIPTFNQFLYMANIEISKIKKTLHITTAPGYKFSVGSRALTRYEFSVEFRYYSNKKAR